MTATPDKTLAFNLIQPDIIWEDIDANIRNIEIMLDSHPKKADIYILPETFATGFTMQSDQFAEDTSGQVLNWLIGKARELDAVFMGGVIFSNGQNYFNRVYWVTPSGQIDHYDKRHLFRMGREQEHYTAGRERKIISYRDFRILPLICYDIRFPVFSRNRNDYDILIYVANWPASRQYVWDTLLRARAIENQCYVLGINRTGVDGEGVIHAGGTSVINPYGHKNAGLEDQPGILFYEISLAEINDFRTRFPVWKDADDFRIIES